MLTKKRIVQSDLVAHLRKFSEEGPYGPSTAIGMLVVS